MNAFRCRCSSAAKTFWIARKVLLKADKVCNNLKGLMRQAWCSLLCFFLNDCAASFTELWLHRSSCGSKLGT